MGLSGVVLFLSTIVSNAQAVEALDVPLKVGQTFSFKNELHIYPDSLTGELESRDVDSFNQVFEYCGFMAKEVSDRGRSSVRQKLVADFISEFYIRDPLLTEKDAKANAHLDYLLSLQKKESYSDFNIPTNLPSGEKALYRVTNISPFLNRNESNIELGYKFDLMPVSFIADLHQVDSIVCFKHTLEDRIPSDLQDYWIEQDLNILFPALTVSAKAMTELLGKNIELLNDLAKAE